MYRCRLSKLAAELCQIVQADRVTPGAHCLDRMIAYLNLGTHTWTFAAPTLCTQHENKIQHWPNLLVSFLLYILSCRRLVIIINSPVTTAFNVFVNSIEKPLVHTPRSSISNQPTYGARKPCSHANSPRSAISDIVSR